MTFKVKEGINIAGTAFVDASRNVTAGNVSGTWTGSAIAIANGGTGATSASAALAALGGASSASLSTYAPLASPALTGTPTAPTATSSDSSTTIATTAFVKAQGYTSGGAALSAANVWTAVQSASSQALTDGATVSIAITKQIWTLTTTAARTIAAPTGGAANTSYRLVLTTGGFTPSWNTVFKFAGGTVPTSLTGVCVFDFFSPDGTTFYCTGQSVGEA